jgi:hypothetical protein
MWQRDGAVGGAGGPDLPTGGGGGGCQEEEVDTERSNVVGGGRRWRGHALSLLRDR